MDIVLERILSLIPQKDGGGFVHGAKKTFAQSIGYKGGEIISDWIAGRSDTYKSKVYEISEKYGVSAEWLLGNTDDPGQKEKPADTKSRGVEKLMSLAEKLSDEQIDNFIAIMESMVGGK